MNSSTIVNIVACCAVSMFVAACDSNSWVELYKTGGCTAKDIEDITGNSDRMLVAGQMAKAFCEANGKSAFAGKFRCDGEKMMAACKN